MTVTLAELARRFQGKVRGNEDVIIEGVASLQTAGPRDIAYVSDRKYLPQLADHQSRSRHSVRSATRHTIQDRRWLLPTLISVSRRWSDLLYPFARIQPGRASDGGRQPRCEGGSDGVDRAAFRGRGGRHDRRGRVYWSRLLYRCQGFDRRKYEINGARVYRRTLRDRQ